MAINPDATIIPDQAEVWLAPNLGYAVAAAAR